MIIKNVLLLIILTFMVTSKLQPIKNVKNTNVKTTKSLKSDLNLTIPIDKIQIKPMNIQSDVNKLVTPLSSQTPTSNVNNLQLFSNNTFNGFTDGYKAQMAYLISSIKNLNTNQGKLLTDKLTISLISIANTLKLINMNKSNQNSLKPLLQYQVKTLMTDLDRVQDHLNSISGTIINGNSNYVAGKNLIQGNNNIAYGNSNAVVGNNNALVGNNSIVSGYNNGVLGNNGVTIGVNNQVKANNSYIFNNNDVINKDNIMVVGNYIIDLSQLKAGQGKYFSNK